MANSIKKYREKLGLTQLQLADTLKISTVSLSRYENDMRTPHWSDIQTMCQLFGCTADELMGSNPTPSPAAEDRQGTTETAQ